MSFTRQNTYLKGGLILPNSLNTFRLTPITRAIFSKLDAPILTYIQENESTVDPEYFVHILPSLLVNGSEGRSSTQCSSFRIYM